VSYTRVDLVEMIATFLGKLVAGQNMEDEDAAAIDSRLPAIIATLNARGVTYIPDIEEIDDEKFDPLARICAAKLSTVFSVPLDTLTGFRGEPMRSESELRAIGRTRSFDDVVRFNNF
jgi:electron transfer flavoprotein alpha/beta subunit